MYLLIIVVTCENRISVVVTPPFPAEAQAPAFMDQNPQGSF